MKKSSSFLDTDTINKIKVIIAKSLASDDELLEMLILKGGNAISLGYAIQKTPISATPPPSPALHPQSSNL